jgi:hypothetical protein
LASPALTGTPTAPTATTGDSSTKLATTAFVANTVAAVSSGVTQVVGASGNVTLANLTAGGMAPLASPALTGTPTAPTATAGTNTTQLATTAFVQGQGFITSTGAPVQSVAGRTGAVTLAVADISGALSASTAASTYAPLANPAFTGSLGLPSWTTAGRPSPATAGMIGWNTDLARFDHCVAAGSPGTWKNFARLDGDTLAGRLNLFSYGEKIAAPSISAGTLTLDMSTSGVFSVTLNANITTLTISNVPSTSSTNHTLVLLFTADGTARSVTWPGSVTWGSAGAPTLTSTNTKRDLFVLTSFDNGTSWLAIAAGQAF